MNKVYFIAGTAQPGVQGQLIKILNQCAVDGFEVVAIVGDQVQVKKSPLLTARQQPPFFPAHVVYACCSPEWYEKVKGIPYNHVASENSCIEISIGGAP